MDRKEVLNDACTPNALVVESSAPTTTADCAVARTEAATMATVERPEIRKVQQDPMREQIATRPKRSSTTQVTTATM